MRIVITKDGKKYIQDLETNIIIEMDNKNFFGTTSNSNTNLNNNNTELQCNLITNFSPKKIGNKHYKNVLSSSFYGKKFIHLFGKDRKKMKSNIGNYFYRDERNVNDDELKKAEKIHLNIPKLNMSPIFMDKYHASEISEEIPKISSNKHIVRNNSMPDIYSNKENNTILKNCSSHRVINKNHIEQSENEINEESQISKKKKSIKLRELVSKNEIKKLKNHILHGVCQNKKLPFESFNNTGYNFRFNYINKKEINDNFDFMMNKEINSERTNLIKYLKGKKCLAPFYLENLVNSDESHIYKLNKICQSVFNKQQKEERNKEIRNEKNFEKEMHIKEKTSKSITKMDNIMNEAKRMIQNYEMKSLKQKNNKQKIIKEQFLKIKNEYWDKFKVDDFYFNTRFKDKKLDTTINSINHVKSLNNSGFIKARPIYSLIGSKGKNLSEEKINNFSDIPNLKSDSQSKE